MNTTGTPLSSPKLNALDGWPQAVRAISRRTFCSPTSLASPLPPRMPIIAGSPDLDRFQEFLELRPDFRMLQAQLDCGLQITDLGSAVVAAALEVVGKHRLLMHQLGERIGQLDL